MIIIKWKWRAKNILIVGIASCKWVKKIKRIILRIKLKIGQILNSFCKSKLF